MPSRECDWFSNLSVSLGFRLEGGATTWLHHQSEFLWLTILNRFGVTSPLLLRKHPDLQIICEVSDGLEAVQRAEELQPDLILLDIGLPKLNGIEAANRIRRVAPEAAIIFLTENRNKEIIRAALSTGARGYVLKMDAGRELLPAVAGVLGGDDFVSSGIAGVADETEST